MKVLKWFAIVITSLLALLVIIGFVMPREVVVSTSGEISVPQHRVFHFVAGFVDRTAWDPWIKADTAAECAFDIVPGYTGSKYTWEGPRIGAGMMEVDSVVPGSYILNKATFAKGAPIPEEWSFTPAAGGTAFTWSIKMSSASPFGRIMNSLFKGMIAKTIESGKNDLKTYLESHSFMMSSVSEINVEDFPAVEALTMTRQANTQQMSEALGQCYAAVYGELQSQNLQPQGSPFVYYTAYNPETDMFTMTAGVPVSQGGKSTDQVKVMKFKEFRAVKGLHTGPYDELQVSYEALMDYAGDNSITLGEDSWEFYLNDPSQVNDPALLQTVIAMPVKK